MKCIAKCVVFFFYQAATVQATMEDTLSIALLKDVLAEIPADEQTHVTQMVEALDDNDMSAACLFLHERFQVYFQSLDAIMKTITTVEKLQQAWMKQHAITLLSKYSEVKEFLSGMEIELKDLHVNDQKKLSLANPSLDDLPTLRDSVEEKASCWLQSVPKDVRASVTDVALKKSWVKDNFSVLFLSFQCCTHPVTPPKSTRDLSPSMHDMASPEKKKREVPTFPDNDNMSQGKKQRVGNIDNQYSQLHDDKYTPLNAIGGNGIPKLRYSCLAKVLMVGGVIQIPLSAGKDKLLPKLTYIIGSKDCTVEVTVLGPSVQKIATELSALKGSIITLDNVVWDAKYSVLKHVPGTLMQRSNQWDGQFSDVDFKLTLFHMIGTLKAWSRLSVQGCLHSLEVAQASERTMGQSYFDCFLQNRTGQGVRVRIVAYDDLLPQLEEGQEIILRNAKINTGSEALHADLGDLSELEVLGNPSTDYPANLTSMVVWQQH